MKPENTLSRRSFVTLAGAAPLAGIANAAYKNVPVGLEMYSVRTEMAKDLMGTIRKVAGYGYQVMEFYAPYTKWTDQEAKDVRKLLDDLGVKCNSLHTNNADFRTPELIKRAIELNQIVGSKTMIMAAPGRITNGLDGWKQLAEMLTNLSNQLTPLGMRGGIHNHQAEFTPVDGKRPIEVIAENTPKEFTLQFDVGTCVEMGSDPVAWIKANPGRIRSMHCKDWAPGTRQDEKGYRVLFSEGVCPWKEIFAAAESVGGIEYYLIEQEGSRFSEFETAERCMANWKKFRAS